ncbi:response regulator [Sapientia aquatica]|uniref:Response regulator n=1 Tax=Sapientia aquatica TaxID=1549640 RepID=A0A4R5W5M6_9BURK|nr:response regulator [Sapientia aquatica]TDK67366.1 response regulator [Sapientia aquatica]
MLIEMSGDEQRLSEPVLNVLVVDDDELMQHTLSVYLSSLGHSDVIASNGQQALDCLRDEHFDVILLDINMPVMNGSEVLAAIRKQEQQTGIHQIIIMVTGYAETDDLRKLTEAGADGYVVKPVDPIKLEFELIRLTR